MGGTLLIKMPGKRLAGRGLVAVSLFVGYYILSLAVAAALFLVPYLQTRLNLHFTWLAWSCLLAGFMVLQSIIPRVDRFVAPGPRLSPETHPRLFEEIGQVARALDQKAPQDVYLIAEPNAGVAQRGGLMGIGSRRVMFLGLTYMQALTVEEFRTVLAHEFGHYWGGDTKLGPWVFKTGANIGRTLERLGGQRASGLDETAKKGGLFGGLYGYIKLAAMKPFELYAHMYLRVTSGISRRQEFVADRLAMACAGREATVSGLRKGFAAAAVFGSYWGGALSPALNAGFLPPYAAGFGAFLECETVKRGLAEAVDKEIESGSSQPDDSHPSLKERIEALSGLPAGPSHDPAGEPAVSLLQGLPELERELFRTLNPDKSETLKPIAWDEVLGAVYVPYWGTLAQKHRSDLAGIALGNLPETVGRIDELGEKLAETARLVSTPEDIKGYTTYAIYAAAASKLVELGWQATAGFVSYVTLSRGDLSWEPLPRISELVNGTLPADQWQELCAKLGIAEIRLSEDTGSGPQAEPEQDQERQRSLRRARILRDHSRVRRSAP
jgi:heat shock protein HtpX